MKRTKIVCTMGPSCTAPDILPELMRAGMDVARLNFSHGSHESHAATVELIRQAAASVGRPVAVLQDLCGPKIRLGPMQDGTVVRPGMAFTLRAGDALGDVRHATVSYERLATEVPVGACALIDDGLIEMRVVSVQDGALQCEVVTGGPLGSHKGVNFPHVSLSVPSVTDYDWDDLKFGLSLGVDFVALSFVRSATDIHHVKTVISAAGFDTPVIAKIEKFEALEKLEEILHAADGAMVARGDLGVETAFECVPLEQKRIIAMCRRLGKPVITATQMLDSMIRNPRPTRAEVTDVANAVLDGTDAVMLSGETASGAYPLDAVRVMATIAQRTEASPLARGADPGHEEESVGHVLSRATCDIAQALQASLIIACTTSGATARWLSAFRPEVPILAVTHDERLVRRLCLSRGVFPVAVALSDTTDQLLTQARDAAIASGLARERDLAVIQAGIPPGSRGSTNMIKLDVLGHTFHRGIAAGPARTVTGRTVIEGGTAGPGDILVLRRLVDVPPAGLAGVITEEDTPSGVERLAAAAVPGVLAIPGACRLFGDGRSVTLDSARGLVYEG